MATRLSEILRNNQQSLLTEWTTELKSALSRKLIKDGELEEQCTAFLAALDHGASSGQVSTLEDKSWSEMKEVLGSVSRTRAQAGYSPSETAVFVFSLKRPLFVFVGRALFRGLEKQGGLGVYEMVARENPLFTMLSQHHLPQWLSERKAGAPMDTGDLTGLLRSNA